MCDTTKGVLFEYICVILLKMRNMTHITVVDIGRGFNGRGIKSEYNYIAFSFLLISKTTFFCIYLAIEIVQVSKQNFVLFTFDLYYLCCLLSICVC